MIFEIATALQAKLIAEQHDCPIRVFCAGDRKMPTGWTPERIVVEHDLGGADAFAGPRSQRYNPKHSYARAIAAKATIYAKEPAQAATQFEHRARAEKILHQVLAGMREVGADRKNRFTPKAGKFITPADVAASDTHAGAAYELKFTFEQAVRNVKWSGSGKPTAVLAKVGMTGSPTLTFADVGGSGDTITRSAGSWLTDGFAVGMQVRVRGAVNAANNFTDGAITALTATVMTFGATPALVNEVVTGAKVTAGGVVTTGWVALNDDDNNPLTVPAGAQAMT